MKTYLTTAVTILAVLMLSSGGLLVTHAAAPPSQTLNLSIAGVVQNVGSQHYLIHQQGPAYVDEALTTLTYNLNANVKGVSVSGTADFKSGNGVSGHAQIVGMVPAACFPIDNPLQPCDLALTSYTSAIPAFFVGVTSQGTIIYFESPYMNPFGAPIVIAGNDGTLVVTPYSQGTIDWQNATVQGAIYNAAGSQIGYFTQAAQEHEDLVAGTSTDHGTLSMSLDSGTFTGNYQGSSVIPPAAPGSDCSASLNLPLGTCTLTGFISTGNFNLNNHGSKLSGTYNIDWGTPAVVPTGTATVTLTTH